VNPYKRNHNQKVKNCKEFNNALRILKNAIEKAINNPNIQSINQLFDNRRDVEDVLKFMNLDYQTCGTLIKEEKKEEKKKRKNTSEDDYTSEDDSV